MGSCIVSRVFERSRLVQRGRIIALAAGILAVGICAALPFQHRIVTQRDQQESAVAKDDLRWRGFDETFPSRSPLDRPPAVAISDDEPRQSVPLKTNPPNVTRPATLPAATPPPQLPMNFPFRQTESQAPRRHRIADGDNLQSLAEEYLGSADRYEEIYDANRDVLSSPDLLPIGVEILIPSP
jgi:nucleoid-associated protein YgaU